MKSTRLISILLFVAIAAVTTDAASAPKRQVRDGKTHSIVKDQLAEIHTVEKYDDSRELSSLWGFFAALLHCPPGPLGKHCHEHHSGGGKGGDGSGADGSGSDGSDGSDGSGSDYDGGRSANGDYDGYDSSASTSATDGSDGSGTNGAAGAVAKFFKSTEGKITAVVLACCAASVAIAAMYMGSRRRTGGGPKHALHGMIKKRIGLFSRMANRSKCGTCRPESVKSAVLEGSNESSVDYRLA
ncbi:predicted protein [Chaetoceros tenuissimus]|uniref:Uncharacterized protein n=1 Tax=Chaetoceros tenuissimus TaxID=426638 RepID=A0AAD3CUI6_9STRA|nr:predicted protein [Chaetoceros tenuissimus]